MLRPIFVPSDAYLRAHALHVGSGVTRSSSIVAEELGLEPCEDYSAMKIAIKHSCSLNKDVVFCCTRHLLHQLGEALSSGRPVALDLGVGILSGRDRCLSFRFHSQYLAHWPATAAYKLAPQAPPDRCQRQLPGPPAAAPLPLPPQHHYHPGQDNQQVLKPGAGHAAQGDRKGMGAPTPASGRSGGGSNPCEIDRV
ncbi:hypothetical protein VOLCADRAFT_115665, partial [Volvox carteri f. nagariensis]